MIVPILYTAYLDVGDPEYTCKFCGARMWYDESVKACKNPANINFQLCCSMGKVKLLELAPPPEFLKCLMFNNNSEQAKKFRANIRIYNMIFSFTSMGGRVDRSINIGGGPYVFRLNGQNHHKIGSLLPPEGALPKFAQLYVYDTNNEVTNRIQSIR